ncbi:large proline-rich protein BAG6 isoform X4 [Amphiprion ocellaris]|uniref:large proline-rich protein BAG6 isoform X4 n=1 Tax=Amphiprion ocellaris TaxID=80972 RepID=UPI0024112E08|nr:large proline-rich protein BAG6 isoform X4 [Amphiprion ocellaris]
MCVPQLTVKQFKEHIASSVDIPVHKQRLIYQGRVLQDDRTLTEYNVDGKVIHLVERAPPQATMTCPGGMSAYTRGAEPGTSSNHATSQSAPHDRNSNSYVMLGTFNLPVNILDPQQIQMSVQQMMSGVGDAGASARVSSSLESNSLVDVQINLDQSMQSEPRVRLQLAENLLRDACALIHRLENQPAICLPTRLLVSHTATSLNQPPSLWGSSPAGGMASEGAGPCRSPAEVLPPQFHILVIFEGVDADSPVSEGVDVTSPVLEELRAISSPVSPEEFCGNSGLFCPQFYRLDFKDPAIDWNFILPLEEALDSLNGIVRPSHLPGIWTPTPHKRTWLLCRLPPPLSALAVGADVCLQTSGPWERACPIPSLLGVSSDSNFDSEVPQSSSSPPPSSSSLRGAEASQPMDTSSPLAATSSTSSQTERSANTGLNHPSPAEFVDVLSEVRRVEERLHPFLERTHSILGAATSADYNNNMQEREEDQRILNLVGDAVRLLGNTLVVLGDLRCNLATSPPRHLYVVRPIAHYTHPVLLQAGLQHMPIPINLGATVTMTSNVRQAAEEQRQPSEDTGQSNQQATGQGLPLHSNGTTHQGQGAPRVIRITHQTMEPVVMMQMNINGESAAASRGPGQPNVAGPGQPGAAPAHFPGLPPEFMQAIVHQMSHQAPVMAAAASAGHPAQMMSGADSMPSTEAAASPLSPQGRMVITRPSFSPRIPQPVATRGTTINLRATVPTAGQQPGQSTSLAPSSLTQMIGGMVGQLLMPGQPGDPLSISSSTHPQSSYSTSSSSSESSTMSCPLPSANTSGQTPTHTTSSTSISQPAEGSPEANVAQFLASLLGAAGPSGPDFGLAPSITVTLPEAPGFFHGMSDFTPAPVPGPGASSTSQSTGPAPLQAGSNVGGNSLSPELFTGIVQGVLSTMMSALGAQQGSGESIAQFIQRLSQTSNLFAPGSGDAVGFFGDLLSMVCQSISLVDVVLLLHGNAQPLSRIQSQLCDFFTEHYLQGQEPTDANIATAAEDLINGLEEYIAESFATVTVREGVDIVQTNLSFLRQQFTQMASHILRCSDHTFGPRLLLLCTQGLFECLALNLHCLRGEQSALIAVINHHIRRMSAEVNPSLVNWLTSMMSTRLHVILEQNPVTEDQIQHYVISTHGESSQRTETEVQSENSSVQLEDSLSPVAATTVKEAMASSGDTGKRGAPPSDNTTSPKNAQCPAETPKGPEDTAPEMEPWATAVPPEWVPIIRQDMVSQRKVKAHSPLSDAYLHGMPAKRRKTSQCEGPYLSLSDAVSRAARAVGVLPVTAPNSLQGELEKPEVQEVYTKQVKSDIKERVRENPDYNAQRFPNTHRAFSTEDC